MKTFSVTVVTSGWVPVFNFFLDLQTIVLCLGSKKTLSRLATACCLDGVKGTNPNVPIGRWPPINISPKVEEIFYGLSWGIFCSWLSLSWSSCSFRLNSSAIFSTSSFAHSTNSFCILSSSSFYFFSSSFSLWASSTNNFFAPSTNLCVSSSF